MSSASVRGFTSIPGVTFCLLLADESTRDRLEIDVERNARRLAAGCQQYGEHKPPKTKLEFCPSFRVVLMLTGKLKIDPLRPLRVSLDFH
jgi:hypothetical protein